LDEEVRAYFDVVIAKLVAEGVSEREARRMVRIRFAGAEQVTEQVRDVRAGAFLKSCGRDVIRCEVSLKTRLSPS